MDPVLNLTEAAEEDAELEEGHGYIDLSQSRSDSLAKSRGTALAHLNTFLASQGMEAYNRATFDKEFVTIKLFGTFCSYLLATVNKYETASRYFSAVKTVIEEDFASQRLPMFTNNQKWYTRLRATMLQKYMQTAVDNNTRLTDSAPPLMEEVILRSLRCRSALI